MSPGPRRGYPAARGAGKQTRPDQERLSHLLYGLALLAEGHGKRAQTYRTAAETAAQCVQE